MGATVGSGIGCHPHQIVGMVGSRGHAPAERQGGTAQRHQGFDVQCTRIKVHTIGNPLGVMPLLF